tara:strand:- start:371 stop:1219 length:849 start_codon:yes stop_codon:yes gene_type:complete
MENDMKKDDGIVIEKMTDTELIEFANNEVDSSVPKFKLKHFVGGSLITPFHNLKQLFLELKIRQDSYLHIQWEIKRKELEEMVEREKLANCTNDIEKQYIEIDLLNIVKDKKRHEDAQVGALKEKDAILELIRELCDGPQGVLPDGTKLMDVFGNKELEEELERQHWITRLAKQASMEMLAYGRIGTGNMDAIAMLDSKEIGECLQLTSQYTTRVGTGMGLLTDKAINDMKLGYVDPKSKEQMKHIGISDDFLAENMLENDIDKSNTLINNKYKDLKDNSDG